MPDPGGKPVNPLLEAAKRWCQGEGMVGIQWHVGDLKVDAEAGEIGELGEVGYLHHLGRIRCHPACSIVYYFTILIHSARSRVALSCRRNV